MGIEEELELLKDRMNGLQQSVIRYNEEIPSFQSIFAGIKAEEDFAREAFEATMKLIRERKDEAQHKHRELTNGLQDAKWQLNNMEAEYGRLLSLIQAKALIDEIAKSVDEIAQDLLAWQKMSDPQKEDIVFTVHAFMNGKSGVLNGNDMGTGKTAESAVIEYILRRIFIQDQKREPKVLWLTKKSLVMSTRKELLRWQPDRMIVPINGDPNVPETPEMRRIKVEIALANNTMVITNYDAARTTTTLANIEWDFVFIDEVHKLKGGANPGGATGLWTAAKDICAKAKFVVMLSGSPIMNHPREMWSYLHIFDAERFPNVRHFERNYCFGYGEGVEVDFSKLITTLSGQAFRRTKAEFGINLPPKMHVEREVQMTPAQRKVYDQMRTQFFVWLDENQEKAMAATAIIAQLNRLRQINIWPVLEGDLKDADGSIVEHWKLDVPESGKLDEAMDIIEELHENNEQVVVFSSQFNAPLVEIKRRCESQGIRVDLITGASKESVDYYETRFQNREVDVLLINMRTGSEGLNLQKNPGVWEGGASNEIFLDLWWNPATNEQAEDRCYRRGTPESVTIYQLKGTDSVDAFIDSILAEKAGMINGIMESSELRKGDEWKGFLEGLI